MTPVELRGLAKLKITDDGDTILSIKKRDLHALIESYCERCAFGFGMSIGVFAIAMIMMFLADLHK